MAAILGTLPRAVPVMKAPNPMGVAPAAMFTTTEGTVGTRRTTALAQKPCLLSQRITADRDAVW